MIMSELNLFFKYVKINITFVDVVCVTAMIDGKYNYIRNVARGHNTQGAFCLAMVTGFVYMLNKMENSL